MAVRHSFTYKEEQLKAARWPLVSLSATRQMAYKPWFNKSTLKTPSESPKHDIHCPPNPDHDKVRCDLALSSPCFQGLNGGSEGGEKDEGKGKTPEDAGAVHVDIVWGVKDIGVRDEEAIA